MRYCSPEIVHISVSSHVLCFQCDQFVFQSFPAMGPLCRIASAIHLTDISLSVSVWRSLRYGAHRSRDFDAWPPHDCSKDGGRTQHCCLFYSPCSSHTHSKGVNSTSAIDVGVADIYNWRNHEVQHNYNTFLRVFAFDVHGVHSSRKLFRTRAVGRKPRDITLGSNCCSRSSPVPRAGPRSWLWRHNDSWKWK